MKKMALIIMLLGSLIVLCNCSQKTEIKTEKVTYEEESNITTWDDVVIQSWS